MSKTPTLVRIKRVGEEIQFSGAMFVYFYLSVPELHQLAYDIRNVLEEIDVEIAKRSIKERKEKEESR